MANTSAEVRNRYNQKAYDRLTLLIPKGRKETLRETAEQNGETVNALINRTLMTAVGMTEQEWKTKAE